MRVWAICLAGACVLLLLVTAWDVLMEWMPAFEVGTFEAKDWVGVVLAVIGVRLAVVANRISKKQDKHAEEEKAKHSRFDLTCPEVRGQIGSQEGRYTLWVTNVGRRASRGIVYLGVPKEIKSQVRVQAAAGIREVPVLHNWDIRDDTVDHPGQLHFHDDYALLKFDVTEELLPADRRLCVTVLIELRDENRTRAMRTFRWFSQTADERNPASDTSEILLAKESQHWRLED